METNQMSTFLTLLQHIALGTCAAAGLFLFLYAGKYLVDTRLDCDDNPVVWLLGLFGIFLLAGFLIGLLTFLVSMEVE